MKTKSVKYLLIPLITLLVASCSKEKSTDLKPQRHALTINKNPFFPMQVGNIWVYDFNSYTKDGEPNGFLRKDTLEIIGDTLIGNRDFFIFRTNFPNNGIHRFLRDSSSFIIDHRNNVVLTAYPDNDSYNDHVRFYPSTQDTLYEYWDEFPAIIKHTGLIGSWKCLLQQSFHLAYPPFANHLLIDSTLYARVGPVQRSYSFLSGGKMKGNLVYYDLK